MRYEDLLKILNVQDQDHNLNKVLEQFGQIIANYSQATPHSIEDLQALVKNMQSSVDTFTDTLHEFQNTQESKNVTTKHNHELKRHKKPRARSRIKKNNKKWSSV